MKRVYQKVTRLIEWSSRKSGLNLGYFLTNGFWVTFRYALLASTGLLVSVFFTRLATKELLGQYQFIISVYGVLAIFTLPGLNLAVLKAMANGHTRSIYTALRMTLFWGVLAVPLICGYGAYQYFQGAHDIGITLMLAGVAFPLFYAPLVWIIPYDNKLQFRAHALRTIITNIVLTAGLVSGLLFGAGLTTLILIYLTVNILLNWLFLYEVLRGIEEGSSELDKKYGLIVSFQKFVYGLSNNVPALLVSYFFGFHFLAIFYIANAFLNFLSGFISSLSNLYVPLLFKYNRIAYGKILVQNLLLGLVFFLFGLVFLKLFFLLLYGKDYQDSLSLAYLFSGLLILLPLRIFLVNFFTAREKNDYVIVSYISGNAIGCLLFFFFRHLDPFVSVSLYIYALHLLLVFPLLILYFRWQRQESAPSSAPQVPPQIFPDTV